MRVVLGVGGGIAAYKSAHLLRLFTESGSHVRVIPTTSALSFVGAATWEALSGQPVTTDIFDNVHQVDHVRLGQEADLIVIAPATADLISRIATGRADDLLTASLLVATCPVVVVPAMHTEMWNNPATVDNIAVLRSRGLHVMEPAVGRLTGSDSGPGRMPEPADIMQYIAEQHLTAPDVTRDLTDKHVIITAGGTREPIDPVRYIGNRSSGRQGIALAQAAHKRGAKVTLIAAHTEVPLPQEVTVHQVNTALDMRAAVKELAADADIVIMAAAVADYRPTTVAAHKMKKTSDGPPTIDLVENPDILADIAHNRTHNGQIIVGFAAETGDTTASVHEHGVAKAQRKGADLLVINEVSDTKGFGTPDNTIVVVRPDGGQVEQFTGTKRQVADVILDHIVKLTAP
ncbi:bifunctional phosphopantothenoylcysteine decarboxylase/phosphopantothenate--cysteine ligase CoaBC [Jonesia quinghaiensis]|uniref:bifunctional phosphopantothenoylcysteine decarboxylase/phosphopantothenate--cysteine ligase CoaBC n=1 Tax=Jonesia quinghaiensis TaxID=262806 RepID=UPI0003F5E1A8|nr:bifunctional phosphopantothenoylcysteine decarboxylase/phosphopantothenate--cysteine ligase CoaBC [Jonesia quinghaiensis]